MNTDRIMPSHRLAGIRGLGCILAVVGLLIVGPPAATGDNLANQLINAYDSPLAGSLEAEMMYRISVTNQFQPADLPRLARLTVLETIAMYQNLRADLRATSIGERIEGEMSTLWESAELFYDSASYPPPDFAGLNRSRALLEDVNAAYQQVDSTLGELPGYSQRAAFHLRDVGRLLPVMNAVFDTIDAKDAAPVAPAANARLDPAALREQARLLSEDLQGLITLVADAKPALTDRDSLIEESNGLLDLVHGFAALISAEPSPPALVESLGLVRRRMWPVEARVRRVAGIPELGRRWRGVRQRINALSDDFGLTRVISLAPGSRPAKAVDRNLLAQVDRALIAVDQFLAQQGAALRTTPEGTEFEGQVARLRLSLRLLRQRVVAQESIGGLSQLLREILAMNQQLSDRSRPDRRIVRGTSASVAPSFRGPAEAVSHLRDFMPNPAVPRS